MWCKHAVFDARMADMELQSDHAAARSNKIRQDPTAGVEFQPGNWARPSPAPCAYQSQYDTVQVGAPRVVGYTARVIHEQTGGGGPVSPRDTVKALMTKRLSCYRAVIVKVYSLGTRVLGRVGGLQCPR